MSEVSIIKYSWQQLYNKAKWLKRDSLFLEIIKQRPLYPKDFVDHDISMFGQKVKMTHDGLLRGNNKWLSDFEFGYILGYMPPSQEKERPNGWYEVCFPMVNANGNPCEFSVSLIREDFIMMNH